MRNIVLIGMMGCGKSTIGYQAAKQAGCPFVDLDTEIEKDAGCSISEIFSAEGEAGFREREARMVRRWAGRAGTVISTGGGVVLRPENVERLRQSGTVVFIDRPLGDILAMADTGNRPLLKQGPEGVRALYESRLPLYRKAADQVLENTGRRGEAVRELVRLIERERRDHLRLAVIGDPVAHSLSPEIHLPVLELYSRDPAYIKVEVPRGSLSDWVYRVRTTGVDGFNLTMPHKQDIFPFLEEIDDAARALGAVNTVVNRGGRLIGYNTDGDGFYQSLSRLGRTATGARMVLLGAGGAAQALAVRGAQRGLGRLTVLNRSPEKAAALAERARAANPALETESGGLSQPEIRAACETADLLVNATPKGMEGAGEPDWQDLSFLEALPQTAVVCDLIYRPAETRLLQAAAARGLKTQNGLWMLIYQAILADEYYLGHSLDRDDMADRVFGRLQDKE